MDKQKLIMWAAIIGGGYLIYSYLKSQGILDSLFPNVTPHVDPAKGVTGGTTTNPAVTDPAKPPVTPSAGSAGSSTIHETPLAVDLDIAAKVLAATGAGAVNSADGWNWYWANASGKAQNVDLFPPDNRGYLMSLKEYISRRTAAGLSGLGYMGMGYAGANAFDGANAWVV